MQDGVSLRGAYVWPITASRNVALLVRVGFTRFFRHDVPSGYRQPITTFASGIDRSFMGGFRVQPSDGRFWFDVTVGPLTQRVITFESKTHKAASIDIGAIVVRRDGGGLGVYLSGTAADISDIRNWTYGYWGTGLVYRF